MTETNIADEFANGTTDYYVFDADVGTFSSTTEFSRLELTLSDNFSDSPVEEAVLSELVSEAKFPASWENTGNFASAGPTQRRVRVGNLVVLTVA